MKLTMKRMHFSYFCALSLALMLASVEIGLARAPTTAKIALSSSRRGAWDIYVMNPDGTAPVGLTRLDGNNYEPTWAPTGRHILFTSDRDGLSDLYLMDADGRNARRVFRKWDVRRQPTWAPDGKRIAYVRGSKEDKKVPQIYIASINGANEEQLADGMFPTWSPDGTEIAFIAKEGELRVINVDTRAEETINAMDGSIPMDLAWSPDGTRLAFTRLALHDFLMDKAHKALDELEKGKRQEGVVVKEEGGAADIKTAVYSINRDGSGLKRLVASDGTKTAAPTWSPRGDALIYQQIVDKALHLFKIDLGGGNLPAQLTFEGANMSADWFDPETLPVAPQPRSLTTTWGKMKRRD